MTLLRYKWHANSCLLKADSSINFDIHGTNESVTVEIKNIFWATPNTYLSEGMEWPMQTHRKYHFKFHLPSTSLHLLLSEGLMCGMCLRCCEWFSWIREPWSQALMGSYLHGVKRALCNCDWPYHSISFFLFVFDNNNKIGTLKFESKHLRDSWVVSDPVSMFLLKTQVLKDWILLGNSTKLLLWVSVFNLGNLERAQVQDVKKVGSNHPRPSLRARPSLTVWEA